MSPDPARVKALFVAALDLPPGERAAFLARECGADPALRARLDELLAAHDASATVDASPATATADAPHATATRDPAGTNSWHTPAGNAGAVIAGRYKLLQRIGEGGMGEVWMAEQTEPVKRRVAVKLIRAERGTSKQVLARFEAERQAIALMDHPHVARLFDAGTTADGTPFFVMELVRGVPLTQFCDEHRLSVPDRLTLFTQICGAVQHAHQKGVIHRDLKPGNILVESHGGKPVPRVIDFGLAKAAGGVRLTEHTLFTGFGTVLGTPLYMAPEQATFDAVDVDTRADVYALGVILYELLTGTTPITREAVKKAALDQVLKLVREQEPPTPSSRLSSSESAPTAAANRQTEPARLGRFVKGELDWIVLKALAKERERRYESATGFAADVERFLNHEPVTAGPPTAGYRLKKFVRRNRGAVIASAVVAAAVLLGFAGTGAGLLEAQRQADRAEQAAHKERQQRQLVEEKQGELAEANGTLEKTNGELNRVNGDLGKANTELGNVNADLGKANGDLTAARRKLEISLARSLLMPFRDKPDPPTYRPEDVRDEMTATEALGVWRVSESVDDRLAELLVSEALKETVATRQLGYRAPYLLQAAVGLHPDRRQRIETLLAGELEKPDLPADRTRGVVSALAALDGLSPETARKAVAAYHPLVLSTDDLGSNPQDSAWRELHRHLAPADVRAAADRYVTGFRQTRLTRNKLQALFDLLARLPAVDAAKLYLQVVRTSRQDIVPHTNTYVPALLDRLDVSDPAFAAVIETMGVNQIEPRQLTRVARQLAAKPGESSRTWAKAALERAVNEALGPGGDGDSVLFLLRPLTPLLSPGELTEFARRAVPLLQQHRAKHSDGDGVNRLFYSGQFALAAAYLPAAEGEKLRRDEADVIAAMLESSDVLWPGFDERGFFQQAFVTEVRHFCVAVAPYGQDDLWVRFSEAALRGAASGSKVLTATPPETPAEEVIKRQQRVIERLSLATRFATHVGSPKGNELRAKVWAAMADSRTKSLRGVSANAYTIAYQLAREVLDPVDQLQVLTERLTDDLALDDLTTLAREVSQILPRASVEVREKTSAALVTRLTKGMAGKPDRGLTLYQPRLVTLSLTRFMPPEDGLAVGRALFARSPSRTFATISTWAESLAEIAGRMPLNQTPKDCQEWFRVIRKEAGVIALPDALGYLSRGLAALAPFVEPAEREASAGEVISQLLKVMEASASHGPYLLASLNKVLPLLPPARQQEALGRAEKVLTRTLAGATDPRARVTAVRAVSELAKQKAVSPAVVLEPLARSGGIGAPTPTTFENDITNFRVVEQTFRQLLNPWTEGDEKAKLRWLVAGVGDGGTSAGGLSAVALMGFQLPPCKLSDQELVDLLKHPFCVGGARRAVLDVLQERFRTPFADQWAFVKYTTEKRLPLDLTTPVKRSAE